MKNTICSEKEFEMIRQLSPHWARLIEEDNGDSLMVPNVLRIVAMECFTDDKRGPAVDSLRRCLKSCLEGKIYRKTPEYDSLITL